MPEKDEGLVPTPLECSIHQDLIAYLNGKKGLFEATASILAKAMPIIEKRRDEFWQDKIRALGEVRKTLIEEAKKQERERVYKEIDDMVIGTTAPFGKRMTEGCLVLDINPIQWQEKTGINWEALKGE